MYLESARGMRRRLNDSFVGTSQAPMNPEPSGAISPREGCPGLLSVTCMYVVESREHWKLLRLTMSRPDMDTVSGLNLTLHRMCTHEWITLISLRPNLVHVSGQLDGQHPGQKAPALPDIADLMPYEVCLSWLTSERYI